LQDSLIYSQQEIILLRWVEVSLQLVRNDENRLGYFDKDFKDGLGFACLLQQYTARSITPLKFMKENCQTEDDLEKNLKVVRESMIEIGIPNVPSLSDFKKPAPREIVLFLVLLFHSLPYYLPRQTIEFKCMLDETVVKNIMVTNPTKKALTYLVKLEGMSDFSIENDSIMILPKQTGQFPVKFYARVSRPVTARITFKA
jgi:hypothetical protein